MQVIIGVNLLSGTISTIVVGSDWCITNLTHGWWVSILSIVGVIEDDVTS